MSNNKITTKVLKTRLDTLLKSIRYVGSDDGKTNKCATCKKEFVIKELQCGHFIKRGNQQLKYEFCNVMPQCRRCNHFMGGCQDKAAYYVIEKHGLNIFREMIERDYKWLNGKLKQLKKSDYIMYYNEWLALTRRIEDTYDIKLIPKSWKRVD